MEKKKEIYTNGLYVIEAKLSHRPGRSIKEARLIGEIIDIKNESKRVVGSAHKIGSSINFPLYHTDEHDEPQFKTMSQIREEKIDSIL